MKKYFICSDVHGFFTIFKKSLEKEGFDIKNKEHILIVCGDLFDRGEEAVECYKFVKKLSKQKRLIYIKGNHEDLLFDCVEELKKYDGCASSHHYSNGTVNTVVQFMKENILDEVLEFIKKNTVDYYELGKYIFVHSYIPTTNNKKVPYLSEGITYKYNPEWRKASKEEWENARWGNPFEIYNQSVYEKDKIIVCGHFHTSWAHYNIEHSIPKEFPDRKDEENFEKAFKPIYFDNLIGIDACTEYSGIINILVLDNEEIK